MVACELAKGRVSAAGALLTAALLIGLSCDDPSSSAGQNRGAAAGETAGTASIGDEDSPGANTTLPPSVGATPIANCQASENYGPEEPGRFAACQLEGEERASWEHGEPTPPGLYQCDCTEGYASVPDASDCEDALRRGCDIDVASLPPAPCNDPDDVEQVCWPVRGNPNEWSCRCAPWEPLGVVSSSSCGEAVSQHCGRCASPRGSCQETSGPRQVEYQAEFDCSCGSGAAGQANSGGLDAGSGGDVQHVGLDAFGDCSLALALSCGYPAAGERCEAPNPAGGAFACSADGEGNWSCDCPRFDECWARSHPVDTCDWGDPTCVHVTHPPPGLDRARVCEGAIYEYCQCPEQ